MKSLQTNASEINIYTKGLDNIILENSSNGFLEVVLEAKSYDEQLIKIDADAKKVAIGFDFEGTETREVIFRKFITKRLQRATAIVKVPKGKKVYVFGENVDIDTKSLLNDLAIYIDNGIVRLNKVQANLLLKLYSGNVYATVKETNINVTSKSGKILVDNVLKEKEYLNSIKSLQEQNTIISLKANIFLTTQ
ncbi:hypothetical protein [Polaribacter sp.]|uniref:hypothetical protein n=1 Tax=Polaribacter sp. TaxID=1920175 RepID=UPI0025E5325D|nr:hypothetical protein [Polaribacter sp.]